MSDVHELTATPARRGGARAFFSVFRYSRRAVELVRETSSGLMVAFAVLMLVSGLLPAAIAYVGKLIVDGVVLAAESGAAEHRRAALTWVAVEGGLTAVLLGSRAAQSAAQSLLRALLGLRVNVLILEKALSLDLVHFEDSEIYDRMTRARREASSRPLSLVRRTFGLLQNALSLAGYGALLVAFSPLAVLVLLLAAVPAFLAETRYAGEAFRLFKWRTPETRQQMYLESVLAREDYAKEVQLFGLGPLLLRRYREIFDRLFEEDRSLTLRRSGWGYLLGLVGTVAFYAVYAWIAWATVAGRITLGEMTMYLIVFKQGQNSFTQILTAVGGMYEDNLYLSNLYEFLEMDVQDRQGGASEGPEPGGGLRFEGVHFTYPGAEEPALRGVSLELRPGEKLALVGHNGSGKTTLIKLLTRLYRPSEGRILLDGLPLQDWDRDVLRERIGVIFQDFVRYQFVVGENIGVGDVQRIEDQDRLVDAARKGMADRFIDELPQGYRTQLGRWFQDGRELSIGQWQKIALARAFMRREADILVLDEPTAAMDAEAEVQIFDRFRELAEDRMAILISHRFSTVRMADRIVVLEGGELVEQGTHEELMGEQGLYARLFTLQAQGYK